jgi:hypothetical protein
MPDRFRMLRIGALLALCSVAPGAMTGTADGPAPSARELHTIECIAALEVKADALAKQVKAGQTELQALLLSTLNDGAAFIGHAYLQGDRDEARSQALRDAALLAQKTLPGAELAARQDACAQEGERLLSQADIISRFFVTRLAKRQMQKLLGN